MLAELVVYGVAALAACVACVILVRNIESSQSPLVQDVSKVVESAADKVDPSSETK